MTPDKKLNAFIANLATDELQTIMIRMSLGTREEEIEVRNRIDSELERRLSSGSFMNHISAMEKMMDAAFSIQGRHIIAKHKGATRAEILALQDDVANELRDIDSIRSDIFARYPGIRGYFQQSQLDVLSICEQKMYAIFDNVSDMVHTTAVGA